MKKLLWGFLILITLPISLVIVVKVWASKQNKKTAELEKIILTKNRCSKKQIDKDHKDSIQTQPAESGSEEEKINDLKPIICDFIVIHIGTTGLNSKLHKMTEIAAIKVKDGQVIETLQTLIKPYQRPGESSYQNQEYLSDKRIEITGITEDMLRSAPGIESVLKEFHSFIGDHLLVGHNINFNFELIKQDIELFMKQSLMNPIVDTRVLSREILPISNYELETVAQYFNVDIEGSHRALAHCKTTLEVYRLLTAQKELATVEIEGQVKKITSSHPLYAKKCVFTNLGSMTLRSVKELLEESGGIAQDNITKSTDFLIVGNREKINQPSVKHKKALEYIDKGQAIEILNESEFFKILLG